MGTINSIIATLISGFWFNGYDYLKDNSIDFTEGKELTYSLLKFHAILISIIAVIVFIFFRDKPPTPPSLSANVER